MLIILSPAWQTLKSPSGVEIPLVSSVTTWGSREGFRKWRVSLLLQMEMSFQLWGHWSRTVPYCTTVVRSRGDGWCSQKLPQCGPNSSTVYIIRTTGLHLAITGLGSYFFFLFCLCCLSQRPSSTTFGVSSFCPHHQQCSGRSHSGNVIPVSRLSKRINSLADSKWRCLKVRPYAWLDKNKILTYLELMLKFLTRKYQVEE